MPDSALRTDGQVGKVWMFSYECAGIAQAGGLGEAVGGLAKTLASDYGLKVTVFLPGHGRQTDAKIKEDYSFSDVSTFIASGYRVGTNSARYRFLAGIERGVLDNIEYMIVKGLDDPTRHWLDDPILYGHDAVFEKMALFSRTVKTYSEYLVATQRRSQLPDLIHVHDWHMIPSGVAVRQNLREQGVDLPMVFTIHLLSHVSLPWHYASEDWCGIRDTPQRISLDSTRASNTSYRQVWEESSQGSLERFGCYEADYITSVSKSYLAVDVAGYVGDVIKGKSGHIYNGCDWDRNDIETEVSRQFQESLETTRTTGNARWDLRKLLLTTAIAGVVPEATSEDEMVSASRRAPSGARVSEAFKSDGPLVLMTGRLSPQKGADVLLDAVPYVKKLVPHVKFLLFLLPSIDHPLEMAVEAKAAAYPENVRVILGRQPSVYMMSHIAADVYAMPSRSEPFGISALEAMGTGNPVVGSNIGGITETVVDILTHHEGGTGLLFPPGDSTALADSLISILLVMKIDEQTRRHNGEVFEDADKIPLQFLQEAVRENSRFGSKLRANCIARVENDFRWKNVGEMALHRYAEASTLAERDS